LVKVKPAKGTGSKVSLRHHVEHMAFSARLNDPAPEVSDASKGPFLVELHQRRETGDIGS
jgi:hypothetical protein